MGDSPLKALGCLALACLLGIWNASARAQAPAAAPTPELVEACEPLFEQGGWVVRNKLFAFERVFGKRALTWTNEDFDKVITLARACHGIRKGETFIDGNNWTSMINAARERVLPISHIAKQVDDFGKKLGVREITLPPCWSFLEYSYDAYAQSDSSASYFGKSFMAMNDEDLEKSILYVNQCLAFLPDYALSSRGIRVADTTRLLNQIMDRALIIQKRRQDYANSPKGEEDLVIDIEGVRIYPTFTAPETREMLLRYNKAANQKRRFTPETVGVLVRLSDRVLEKNSSAYDKAYAEAVKAKVQEEIFRRP